MKKSIFKRVLFSFSLLIICNQYALSTDPSKSLWTKIDWAQLAPATSDQQRTWYPQHYSLFDLSYSKLKQLLSNAPPEKTAASRNLKDFIITLPLPDGNFHSYTLVESPVMEAPLAAAYPDIKTYAGQGIDDPTATIRCDITEFGFHAYILSSTGVLYIDPFISGNTQQYIVYYKHDIPSGLFGMNCVSDSQEDLFSSGEEMNELNSNQKRMYQPTAVSAIGNQLRTYRLALAADAEYTTYFGGTVAKALAGMVTTMNRVNGIYERELDIHMNMVADDTLLIFTNSSSDPYTNTSGSSMLTQNQTTCDGKIGSSNYDIGHVFSTGGGGIASFAVVCNSSNKAKGVTGSTKPKDDPYDVDYVAHEMGHQFGANHTFNSVTSSCSGNRSSTAAYEPGSGSTVMAYAGICGADNLQSHSDAYFHTKSFDEIVTYTQSGNGNSCPVVTNTGNNAPVINIPTTFTIPDQTPFRLTATGSDPDGDLITFCWEQYDLGPSGTWSSPTGDAPIFRSFYATTSGTRLFPKLADILANSTTVGEIKPNIDRTLHFRCTARDNKAGGGGVTHSTGTTDVVVINSGTGFAITSPNTTGISWPGASLKTVTWNVSASDVSPISTPNVNIYLSTDNGNTFPITIATGVPNIGSYSFNVPNIATTSARIMVEGAGNVFFDINDQRFTIVSTVGVEEFNLNSKVNFYPNPGSGNFHFVFNSPITGYCHIYLFDVTGRKVKEFAFHKNQSFIDQSIDLTGISPGMYLLRFEVPEGIAERKLIIEQ